LAAVRSPKAKPSIEVDLDACEIECLFDVLVHMRDSALRLLAERMPRPIPPKKRREAKTIRTAIVERWSTPEVRSYLQEFIYMSGRKMRAEVRDRKGIKDLLEHGVQPGTIIYLAHIEGLDPARTLSLMPVAAQRDFVERQEGLRGLAEVLQQHREDKVEQGQQSLHAAIVRAADRRTRELQERIQVVSQKHERAQHAVANVAATLNQQIETLGQNLDTSRGQIEALHSMVESQRQTIEDLRRQLASEEMRAREAGRRALSQALLGSRVLVVGDDNRQVVYREEVERFGGEFDFLSGFSEPRRASEKAAAADVVVLVTSYVSHKVSGRIGAFGKVVIRVNQSGEHSMREALTHYVLDLLQRDEAYSG